MKAHWLPLWSAAAAAVLASACAVPEKSSSNGAMAAPAATSAPNATPVAVVPLAPPPPAAFVDTVARAGERLLQDAQTAMGSGPRDLVIDPLIDANSGQQTAGTVQMGQQLTTMIKARSPTWNVKPLTRATLVTAPLLLIGTLTPINTTPGSAEPADAFRVCLVLIDLRTARLVSKRVDRASAATVSAEPVAVFHDSPTWSRDKTTAAYIKSCQGSSPGDAVDPAYLSRLPAEALINEAVTAYGDNKMAEAYKLYHEARSVADPDDLRVLNGLYLTSWRTGKKKEAGETFSHIVAAGLDAKRLPIKIFFTPGSTALLKGADLQQQYTLWLREVALQAAKSDSCMKVVGHTSRTGAADANDVLSVKRATFIKQSLERHNKKLAAKLTADGVGSRENLVGLGTDDMRDALDRRVEFLPGSCS